MSLRNTGGLCRLIFDVQFFLPHVLCSECSNWYIIRNMIHFQNDEEDGCPGRQRRWGDGEQYIRNLKMETCDWNKNMYAYQYQKPTTIHSINFMHILMRTFCSQLRLSLFANNEKQFSVEERRWTEISELSGFFGCWQWLSMNTSLWITLFIW